MSKRDFLTKKQQELEGEIEAKKEKVGYFTFNTVYHIIYHTVYHIIHHTVYTTLYTTPYTRRSKRS